MRSLVASTRAMGYSDIYLDLLAGVEPARRFYSVSSIDEAAGNLDGITYDRDKITAILAEQNRVYGASEETLANIQRLKEKNALCVFCGQQAGLFSGPLLVIIKAITIVKAARLYSRQLGRPVIPVFWIVGDDHDFKEVNHACVLDRQSQPVRLAYASSPDRELPMAETVFSNEQELNRVKELLRNTLGETDFTDELNELIDRSYTSRDSFVTAFGKFMTGLMGRLGLILFSPADVQVKSHAIPLFKSIVYRQNELHRVLRETNLGYDACFLAGLKKLDIAGEPYRPRKIIYVSYFLNTDYSFLVDISSEFEKKCEAVAAYKSQFADRVTAKHIFQPGLDIYDLMRVQASQLGQLVGVQYAEAFTVKERILVDDPQKMPVPSV